MPSIDCFLHSLQDTLVCITPGKWNNPVVRHSGTIVEGGVGREAGQQTWVNLSSLNSK